MNVVTAADSGFFHCLKELADSVRRCYGKPLIVYDLGLTDEHKTALDAEVVPIEIDEKVDHKGKSLLCDSGIASTRATHKPFCVEHYFQNHDEPMIFVDADVIFVEQVELTGFDLAVTRGISKNKNVVYQNGVINSGVIFFNSPCSELLKRWAGECEKPDTTDQKALSDVLEETIDWDKFDIIQNWHDLRVKVLNAKIYNDYHLTKKGKILHFINTKHAPDIFPQLMAAYRKGKDIRKVFRQIKRGRPSGLKGLIWKIKKLFSK